MKLSYSLGLFVGPLLHALKLGGGWVGGILVSAQGPLVLALGLRVWGQGLTIVLVRDVIRAQLLLQLRLVNRFSSNFDLGFIWVLEGN